MRVSPVTTCRPLSLPLFYPLFSQWKVIESKQDNDQYLYFEITDPLVMIALIQKEEKRLPVSALDSEILYQVKYMDCIFFPALFRFFQN